MKKILILFILVLTILLGTFYSEGMDTYVMKNAFVNNSTGAGRFTTIDTDGNFSSSGSDIVISTASNGNDNTMHYTTPPPAVLNTIQNYLPTSDNTIFNKGVIQGLIKD